MSTIRGVLLAGKFRTQHELNNMSHDDQRNTLIVELTAHSNQSNYQGIPTTPPSREWVPFLFSFARPSSAMTPLSKL